MSIDPTIASVGLQLPLGESAKVSQAAPSSGPDFEAMLANAISETNNAALTADARVQAFVSGEDVPVHEVMLALTKADTQMRLFTGVVSRAIDAYREISRIDV